MISKLIYTRVTAVFFFLSFLFYQVAKREDTSIIIFSLNSTVDIITWYDFALGLQYLGTEYMQIVLEYALTWWILAELQVVNKKFGVCFCVIGKLVYISFSDSLKFSMHICLYFVVTQAYGLWRPIIVIKRILGRLMQISLENFNWHLKVYNMGQWRKTRASCVRYVASAHFHQMFTEWSCIEGYTADDHVQPLGVWYYQPD